MLPTTRDALAQLLARTFPHSRDLDPATLDAFVDGLMRVRTRVESEDPEDRRRPGEHPHEHSLFTLRATHARRTPVTSVFTGENHAVRVRLPSDQPAAIETPFGVVLPDDHLLASVREVRERFGDRIGRSFERIDLLTPPRESAIRFAPMSLYFGYEHEEGEPSFVIYEPGDALGRPGALYLGTTLAAVIEEPAGYKPTPLSSPEHWYTGGIRMAANGRDPEVLYMHAAEQRGGEPHFRLHVEYVISDASESVEPIKNLVEAALRMMAVEKGVGADLNVIERFVAETGLAMLPWIDKPERPDKPERIEIEAFVPNHAFDGFLAELSDAERASFEASVVLLLGAVVRADGKFDRLERIEVDWTMNFKVPAALGDAFRFSAAAAREYAALLEPDCRAPGPSFQTRLAELATIVRRLPEPLHERYTSFMLEICRDAAEASGEWLWFGTKVGAEEKQVLHEIAAALELETLA